MELSKVRSNDLRIGAPVAWNLYDENGKLLLARGMVLESERQLEVLLERGLFRDLPISHRAQKVTEVAPPASDERLCGLEDIRLAIGDNLQLHGEEGRHNVRLIGFLRGKSVITSAPPIANPLLGLREGQSFIVRLFSGKHVYAFSSTLFKHSSLPYPHLHLTYPAQVSGKAVRQGIRASVKLIVAVVDALGRTNSGTFVDLSAGGGLLVAKAELGVPGERVQVKFRVRVGDVEQYLNLLATIRTTQLVDGQVQHGLQFVDVPHVEQVALTAYVYQCALGSAL